MAMTLSRFSHWIWPGGSSRRTRGLPAESTAMTQGLFPDSPSGFREPSAVGLTSLGGGGARPTKARSRRRGGRSEARVDREHDMVIVPYDGDGGRACLTRTLIAPTGPSAGSSLTPRSSRVMGTRRTASPSLCRATAVAVLSRWPA